MASSSSSCQSFPSFDSSTMCRFQKSLNSFKHSGYVLELAFPNDKIPPALLLKAGLCERIAFPIAAQFWTPVFQPRAGHPALSALPMLMPKAAMHEDNFLA